MADFYSAWASSPNNGAKYRLHLIVLIASQDVAANTTTLEWGIRLEKDRSFDGFYGYSASWSCTINSVPVDSDSGVMPPVPWTGWSAYGITQSTITVSHDSAGRFVGMPVAATYTGPHSGWSIGAVSISDSMDLPTIPRATIPTVAPSPATIGSSVTIALPAAVGTYTHDITWVSGALSGTIATGVTGNQTWTVPDVSSQFSGQALMPIAITVVTKSGGTAIGSNQVTLLSREAPASPVLTPHDPDGQFDVRARLVTYQTSDSSWAARQQLPANEVQLVDSASATATCTVSLSKLNDVDFTDYSVVDVDVFDGNDWIYTNHRFVLSRTDTDDVDPTEMGTYTGTEFVDYELGYAYLQQDYKWDGATGDSAPTTPGEMLSSILADAQSRGWGPRINFTFDGTKTSLGDPWANTAVNRTFSAGTPVSQMLAGLVSDGLVEYRTEYHDDKAWLVLLNPGTGSDFSAIGAEPVVNLALAPLTRAPRRATMEGQVTAVTVAGDNSLQVTRTQTPFDANVFGRMESWVSATGVADATSANAIGDNALRDNGTPSAERTFEYNAPDAEPQFYPYSVFQTGDWVLIPNGDDQIKDRINQITIDKTADDTLTLTVLTGDRILSGTASLAKRQSAQTGGSIPAGSQLSPSPLDSRIPTAPTVTSVTSAGYWNSDGAAKSAVTLNWAAVTNALNGAAIDVDLYEVWSRPSVGAVWSYVTSTDQLTVEMDGWDVLVDLEFRVRAQSTAGIYGEFSVDQDETTLAPAVSIAGPDLADLYTDGVGSIYAEWGGTLAGVAPPAYLAYVAAELSTDGGVTYAQAGTPIVAAGSIVINPGAYGDYWVRLRGYDRLGNAGTVSTPQEIVTTDPHVAPAVPVAPTSLAATAGASWNASGFLPTAWFDLTWTTPTLDTNGNAISIAGYDIFGLKAGETVERYLTSSSTNGVRVPVGNGEVWTFRVSATSIYGGVSAKSATVTATANATISAAAAPTPPVLAQYAGILQIQWAGGGMVPQIKTVYATISTTSGGTYTRAGMPLSGAGEIDIPGLAPGDYYAKIVMVDQLGNVSTSAASAKLTLLPITGITYQTSPLANTGIKITTGSLTSYDASGNPTFILNAATGEVWIAPYAAVFDIGAAGTVATTGAATTGVEISDQSSSFNTFIHPSGVQIRNNQTPLSWWEADATDASLVNFFAPRAVIGQRFRVGDYEMLLEAKTTGTRLVTRYKGA